MEEVAKKETLGHIKSAKIDIDNFMNMKTEMDFNQITVLIGHNGSGKTVMLKLNWVYATLANMYLQTRIAGIPMIPEFILQFLLKNTFDDEVLNGTIDVYFEGVNYITSTLEGGKVIKVECSFQEDVLPNGAPVFMSKDTRLMTDLARYLKVKKAMGLPPGMPTNETSMGELLEIYKLYDITYIEQFMSKLDTKVTPDTIKKFNEQFDRFDDKFKLSNIRVDYDLSDIIYTDDKGKEMSARTLGAGHQSLLGMIMFQTL